MSKIIGIDLKKEVMGKYDLPYAQNLDEAPK